MTCKVERITDEFVAETMPIFEEHRKELQSWDMPLNPNWEVYRSLEAKDLLVPFVVRDDNGFIMGYAVFILGNNIHYKDFLFATEDIFYVVPDRRGSRVAVKLIKESEKHFKEIGVDVITHHAKFTNTFSKFLEKLGYKQTEILLAKRLSDG